MTEEELLQVIEKAARDKVTELDLSGKELTALPPEIGKLTQLKILILGIYIVFSTEQDKLLDEEIGNNLRTLPAEIGQLRQLEVLIIIANELSSLPAEIGQLINLQTLDIRFNQLKSLPVEIGQLKNLQYLCLSENHLSSLPAEIGQLNNLQSLELNYNQLSSLPAEIGQLNNLQSLELNYNQLSSLPAEIGQLNNLQSLELNYNQLSSLPAEIGQLNNLQSLELNYNQLSSLPAEIGQLKKLQSLPLWNNKLSSLPAEIGHITHLQFLNLYNNQLSNLPAEIVQLTNLKKLDLRGNPIPIPPEILGTKEWYHDPSNVKEILDFYFRVQDPTETEPLYEAKLLIVGEGGAGKTSLAKKIDNEIYELQSDEKTTEGIKVIQWKFPLENGQEFRVNIWDFGGQEIYHQTHQFFLTERSLYVLVADDRRENTDFYWWLKVVELLSDNSPVFIIKNEKQDRQCEINERQLRGEFLNLKEILPTNLATNRGLDNIKKAIQHHISKLPHVGTPLPKLWVRIRFALENDSRNYMSREEYFNLCKQNGLTNRSEMLQLSRYLHDLGVYLHFQKEKTLKNVVILKPEWGTTAVYKVLDNQTVKDNFGCFTQEDLTEIWQDSKYNEMQDELLQLMKEFKLCYEIPCSPNTYIAPHLLSKDQPEYNWDETKNLILRYEYEFMPKGILSRFIVELHNLIEQQRLVWRNGVIINNNRARAEIIEYYHKKEITIRVSGTQKKDFLSVINHEFQKIHASFERLEYHTLIPCNCSTCCSSKTPYFYKYDTLCDFIQKKRYEIMCYASGDSVNVRNLIDDVIEPNYLRDEKSGLGFSGKHPEHQQQNTFNNCTIIQEAPSMSNTYQSHSGSGDNVGRDKSTTNNYNNQNLVQAAKDIQALLDQLSQEYGSNSVIVGAKAIEEIERNPTLKQRIINAIKETSVEALNQLVNHPAMNIITAGVKGYLDA